MKYRYETHCHSAQCSRCAHSPAEELVRAYHAAGYTGLVLTDHFVLGNTAVDRSLPWQRQIEQYENAFLSAKTAAANLDFDVIFGFEHACAGSEFLCYGITPEMLKQNPRIPQLSLEEFSVWVHSHGGVLIQAHPYRWASPGTPLPTHLLDGIEIFNAGNAPEANKAAQAAVTPEMILTSGGDIHIATDHRIGTAGILLPYRVKTTEEFANALRLRNHQII